MSSFSRAQKAIEIVPLTNQLKEIIISWKSHFSLIKIGDVMLQQDYFTQFCIKINRYTNWYFKQLYNHLKKNTKNCFSLFSIDRQSVAMEEVTWKTWGPCWQKPIDKGEQRGKGSFRLQEDRIGWGKKGLGTAEMPHFVF